MSPDPIDEAARRQFESDWVSGSPKPIDFYVPDWEAQSNRGTLEELVLIDLEFRWTQWNEQKSQQGGNDGTHVDEAPPTIEPYVPRYPVLRERATLARLVKECLELARNHGETLHAGDLIKAFPEQTINDSWNIGEEQQAPVERLPMTWGHYELIERLGEGAMGVVYRANHLASDREVALKRIIDSRLLGEGHKDDLIVRFEAESQAAAQLEHDCIVPVYDVGRVHGVPYYTMQLNEGGTLADLIRNQPLTPQAAAKHLIGVSQGIAVAHAANLLHRDIKPANILLDHRTGRAKIADFGLVRWETGASEMTRTGQIVGTPAYMAPEQARDARQAEARSDVYALGATLYHLLTGRPPFQAATLVEMLRQVMHDDPVSPRRLNPSVPRDLETICLRCLEKEPARRFESATALAEDLARFVRGEPVASRPVSLASRAVRWAKRHPAVSIASSLAVAFAISAVVALIVGFYTTSVERTKYEQMYQQAREAVDSFYLQFTEDTLFDQPGMTPVRRRFLLQALGYYERFLKQRQDTAARLDVATTRSRVGALVHELDSPAKAIAHFKQAIKDLEQLPRGERETLAAYEALGDAWNGLGRSLQDSINAKEAITAFENAASARRKYLQLPGANKLRGGRLLANSMMNQGVAYRALNQLKQAEAQQVKAQEERLELLKMYSDNVTLRRDWAKAEYNLGMLLIFVVQDGEFAADERLAQAAKRFGRAEVELGKLAKLDSRDLELQRQRVKCLNELGWLGIGSEAGQRYLAVALELSEQLASEHPKVAVYQMDFARTQQGALQVALESGDEKEAAVLLERNELQVKRLHELLPPSDLNLQWLQSGVHFFSGHLAALRDDRERLVAELRLCKQVLDNLLKSTPNYTQARIRVQKCVDTLKVYAKEVATS